MGLYIDKTKQLPPWNFGKMWLTLSCKEKKEKEYKLRNNVCVEDNLSKVQKQDYAIYPVPSGTYSCMFSPLNAVLGLSTLPSLYSSRGSQACPPFIFQQGSISRQIYLTDNLSYLWCFTSRIVVMGPGWDFIWSCHSANNLVGVLCWYTGCWWCPYCSLWRWWRCKHVRRGTTSPSTPLWV